MSRKSYRNKTNDELAVILAAATTEGDARKVGMVKAVLQERFDASEKRAAELDKMRALSAKQKPKVIARRKKGGTGRNPRPKRTKPQSIANWPVSELRKRILAVDGKGPVANELRAELARRGC